MPLPRTPSRSPPAPAAPPPTRLRESPERRDGAEGINKIEAPLTDRDVEILHQIITRAESLPQVDELPYRTLFAAYDTVLREKDIDPDRDTVLFRTLLRLGGVNAEGSLYEKFEVLLGDYGIHIELGDSDGDGIHSISHSVQESGSVSASEPAYEAASPPPSPPPPPPALPLPQTQDSDFDDPFYATLEQRAARARDLFLQVRVFTHWKRRTAEEIYLSRTAIFAPMLTEFQQNSDVRLARRTLSTLVWRARMERHAAEVNRLRILKETLATWNDNLRCQTISRRIDNRLASQYLYQWVLTERGVTLRSYLDFNLVRRTLATWSQRAYDQQARLEHAAQSVHQHRDTTTLKSVWSRWRLQMQLQRQRQSVASRFLDSRGRERMTREALDAWTTRLEETRRLDRMATNAAFYLGTTKSLRSLQDAVVTSRRQKRRAAYEHVRRGSKMRLAARALAVWRQAGQRVAEADQLAAEAQQRRLLRQATASFDRWSEDAQRATVMAAQAAAVRSDRLVGEHLRIWIARLRQQREMDARAAYRLEMTLLDNAAALLRKLAMRAFQLENNRRSAENLRVRNEKKRFKNMLRHWRDRTTLGNAIGASSLRQSRHQQLRADYDGVLTRGGRGYVEQEDGTDEEKAEEGGDRIDEDEGADEEDEEYEPPGTLGRANGWSSFQQGFDSIAEWVPAATVDATPSHTALPGYLTTPSKRAARAKEAMAARSTVLFDTPLRPPPRLGLSSRRLVSTASRLPRRPAAGLGIGTSDLPLVTPLKRRNS
ncbi:MAG: hypothetical protein M1825_000089 [Sarcosagium campestre]|nr:MAG: hypothetical protein M1825_000089 [Sarcosagium campestre]